VCVIRSVDIEGRLCFRFVSCKRFDLSLAENLLKDEFPDYRYGYSSDEANFTLDISFTEASKKEIEILALQQNLTTLT